MTQNERIRFTLAYFAEKYPTPTTELKFRNSFELLVDVILSAQCTDVRVNQVTPALFEHFPDPATLAASSFDDVFPYIKSISYPNNKTKHLIAMAKLLVSQFHSKIPQTMDELTSLPGVGRKTANVILSVAFGQDALAVDTHVFRVANRTGLAQAQNPMQTERQLSAIIPKSDLGIAHHWLILHGRYTCKARTPICAQCGLTSSCLYFAAMAKGKPFVVAQAPKLKASPGKSKK